MRELMTLTLLALICWWMTGLEPGPATASVDAVPGLGVGIADAVAGEPQADGRLRRTTADTGGSVWTWTDLDSGTLFGAWGRPSDLRRIELTVACHRGGTFGQPDRAQIHTAKRRIQRLLENIGAGAAAGWAATAVDAFVAGDEAPKGRVEQGVRIRIGFDPRFDFVIVRIDRAPDA